MENDFLQKSQQKYSCNYCDYTTSNIFDFNKHNSTRKHKNNEILARMELNGNEKNVNLSQPSINYECNYCNFITINRSNYNAHLSTKKHKQNSSQSLDIDSKNVCSQCNKGFQNASGLWKHKQKCTASDIKREPDEKVLQNTMLNENTFMEIIKTNKELQQFLMEQHNTMMDQNSKLIELAKAGSSTTTGSINNSHNNSHNVTNNQFNLNFFLNETCKDAMNITDFINSLKVTIEDFENTGKVGYIEGISRIIINRLKGIDTNKRPVHCTDAKRETLYVRDQDTWEKDSIDKKKLRTAVKQVARMNLSQLPKWQKENPESEILDTRQNNEYIRYSLVALGGNGQEEEDKFIDKITKNVLREVIIDKDAFKSREPTVLNESQIRETDAPSLL